MMLSRLIPCAVGLVVWCAAGPAGAVPFFGLDNGAFPNQTCSPPGCWTNYLRVSDLDSDGDLDVVFVNYDGFFVPGTAQELHIYENNGSGGFTNVSVAAVGGHSARLREVAIGDVDGDGFVDIYAPDGAGGTDAFFINDGSGSFADELGARLPGAASNAGAARFADFDSDGDLDLFVADGFLAPPVAPSFGHIYINDGAGVFSELDGATPAPVAGEDPDDVDVADFDRDFDLDILLNIHSGPNTLWLNDGDGMFTDASGQLPGVTGNFHYNPGVCDVDGDGDLDVWVDNVGGMFREQLIINDGSANFTNETAARVSNNPSADDNGVVCVDVDHDGDMDAIVVSLGNEERVLENDGDGNFVGMNDAFPAQGDSTLWGEAGDVDGDGRLDFVTGQGEGDTINQLYIGLASAPVDGRAPDIITVEEPDGEVGEGVEPPIRFAVSDASVTDEGPRLDRAFLRVTVDGSDNEVDAAFMGGDLFRGVLPAQDQGTSVEYVACAVDPQGNEGCSDPVMYDVGEPPAGSTGTDSDTSAGSVSNTGVDSTDGGVSNSAGSMTSAGTADETGTGSGGGSDSDGGGCGCRAASRRPLIGVGLLLVVLGGLRRRRHGVQSAHS